MAREEHDREDLMAEATALVQRAELELPGIAESLIVGFRRNGAGCLYVGPESVFQFNPQGQLRRGFVDGLMLKANHGQLVQLRRQRQASGVTLLRRPYPQDQQARFLRQAADYLQAIDRGLRNDSAVILQQVPAEADLKQIILEWIARVPQPIRVARRPHAGK